MDLQKELEEKLVKIKGKVAHVPNARKDLPKWLDRGKLFDSEHVIIEEGKFGLCEENSAKFYWKNRNNDKGMCIQAGKRAVRRREGAVYALPYDDVRQ